MMRMTEAEAKAKAATLEQVDGRPRTVWPEFFTKADRKANRPFGWRVQDEPQVGDDISHGIGGDAYYDGKCIALTRTRMTVEHPETKRISYYTRKGTGRWSCRGASYCPMWIGIHEKRDPHF